MYIPHIYSFFYHFQSCWTQLRFPESTFLCVIALQFFPQNPRGWFQNIWVFFIKSWIGIMDYAFLNYSRLFMINDTYIFVENWIENLNLVPLPRDCMHWEWTKDSGWKLWRFECATIIITPNVFLCKIAKLVILVRGQKMLVWGLATRHHNY